MALARVKVWVPGDTLTAADLNAEFNNLLNNALALISPLTGTLNVNGNLLQNIQLDGPFFYPRLTWTNATTLTLAAGMVPLATGRLEKTSAITLSNVGLAANTTYFIYYVLGGTLEASVTGHATHTSGIETKTGDTTRTLVGMIRTQGSTPGQFVDSATQRFTVSYFGRRSIGAQNVNAANRTTTSTTAVELTTTIRVEFLTWADEAVSVLLVGAARNDTTTQNTTTQIGFDGTTAEEGGTYFTENVINAWSSVTCGLLKNGLAEGYHFATMLGLVSANTGTWYGSAGTDGRFTLSVAVRG